jgi:hypothetical protein
MNPEAPENVPAIAEDSSDIIIIRDPEIDVEALMQQVRANVAQRRAAGAYQEDLDAIAEEVRAQVLSSQLAPARGGDSHGASPLLAELEGRWLVREPQFSSKAPVLGPLIVAVRRSWNWVSTKWYVRGILDQQVGFNALVVQALTEMHRANQSLETQMAELQALCAEQREEIAEFRERLAKCEIGQVFDKSTEA